MTTHTRPIIEADLHAFVDGQMDFERRAVIVQAMASDPDLRTKIEQWRRQNEALTATFGGILREPLPLRLMPTNCERGTTSGPARLAQPRKAPPVDVRPAPVVTGRVIGLALTVFVAGGALGFLGDALATNAGLIGGGKPVETAAFFGARALAIRAYEAHRTYATDLTHPVEVTASDETHLVNWIQHRLSMPIQIPDLRQQGWALIGGRVLPGEFGPAAFLLYGDGIERLGLYMARTNTRQGAAFSIYDNGAGLGSVGYWVDEPVGYAITTSRDAAWLDQNGHELQRNIGIQVRGNDSSE